MSWRGVYHQIERTGQVGSAKDSSSASVETHRPGIAEEMVSALRDMRRSRDGLRGTPGIAEEMVSALRGRWSALRKTGGSRNPRLALAAKG